MATVQVQARSVGLKVLTIDDSEQLKKDFGIIPWCRLIHTREEVLGVLFQEPVWDLIAYDISLSPEVTPWILAHRDRVRSLIIYPARLELEVAQLKAAGFIHTYNARWPTLPDYITVLYMSVEPIETGATDVRA